MGADRFIEDVVGAIADALSPLRAAASEPAAFADLVTQLGWAPPDHELDLGALAGFRGVAEAAGTLADAWEAYAAGDPDSAALNTVVEQAIDMLAAIAALAAPDADGLPDPVGRPEFWEQMAGDLAGLLLGQYLQRQQPVLYVVMRLTGILARDAVPADDWRPADARRMVLHWDRLGVLLSDPGEVFAQTYGWGGPLDAVGLLGALEEASQVLGLPAGQVAADAELVSMYYGSLPTDPPVMARAVLVTARPWLDPTGSATTDVEAGLHVLPIPDAPGSEVPTGLLVGSYVLGGGSIGTRFSESVTVEVFAQVDTPSLVGLHLRPGAVSVVGLVDPEVGVGARVAYLPPAPVRLFGDPSTLGAQVTSVLAEVSAQFSLEGLEDVAVTVAFQGLSLGVDLSEGDNFLTSFMPGTAMTVTTDLECTWSHANGLRISGSGSLERSWVLNLNLGPLNVRTLSIAAGATATGPRLATRLGLDVRLGPVAASVEGVGFALDLRTDRAGALPGAALELDFVPPKGVGMSVEAGVVVGGGYLFFDPENEQYAGGLHLQFENLTLNAFGLLTTRMPDGSHGFSLLVLVQASGFTPIQLGLGFTLNGVGGLFGVNRTVAVDVLRAGVRNRTLDAILFSQDDPTPRAPQIISTLQAVFPPAADQYVFGPMAQIGWGSPTLITIELALILELPSPIRLIILGRVRTALPDVDHPIVKINLDAVGIIDFDRRELSIDASLYESQVGPFALSGDMATRATWGDNPSFALAVGGFHPAFKPPPGFPVLRRLALALSTGDNPRIRMECYFALTSNTVQAGARLELYVKIASFSLEGGLGFDTLIQFTPFQLLAEIHAHLALKRGSTTLMGIDIHIHLRGPSPWILWGEAKVKILFISVSLPFYVEIGRAEAVPEIESKVVWELLRPVLQADAAWRAQLPSEGGQLVTIRELARADGEVPAHPLGTLAVSQNLIPLGQTLGLVGSVAPRGFDEFSISGAVGLHVDGDITDFFAPAQFRRMSDADRLASPAYERMVSGSRLSSDQEVVFGHVQELPLEYEQSVILDIEEEPRHPTVTYVPTAEAVTAQVQHGPAGTADLRQEGRQKFAPPPAETVPAPVLKEPAYVVVGRDNLERAAGAPKGSYTCAAEWLRQHPDRADLQVVPTREEVIPREEVLA